MDLSSLADLEPQFAGRARTRGEAYFRERRVYLEHWDGAGIEALVQGSQLYGVSLQRAGKGRAWKLSCTCPAFTELGPCKHLWATILTLLSEGDDAGSGEARVRTPRPEVLADEPRDRRRTIDPTVAFLGELTRGEMGPAGPDDHGDRRSDWRGALEELSRDQRSVPRARRPATPQRLRYLLVNRSDYETRAELEVGVERLYKRGVWSEPKPVGFGSHLDARALSEKDREILALLQGATEPGDRWTYQAVGSFGIQPVLQPILLPRMARTGRLHLSVDSWLERETGPLAFDDGGRWCLGIRLARSESGKTLSLEGLLARGDERLALTDVELLLPSGFFATRERLGEVDWRGAWRWSRVLHRHGRIDVPQRHATELLERMGGLEGDPLVEGPGVAREVSGPPKPWLLLSAPDALGSRNAKVACRVAFDYGGHRISLSDPGTLRASDGELVHIQRDPEGERAALAQLAALGARLDGSSRPDRHAALDSLALPALVRALLAEGWGVEAEGKPYRSEGRLSLSVRSGADWFDLDGALVFGEASAPLPELLRAVRSGQRVVRLSDGSWGLVPEAWLAGWGLAACASAHGGVLRFARAQAWILDTLLAEREAVDVDSVFERARAALRRIDQLEPACEPAGFRGELRAYQREGLGWLGFLGELGLGGCLADDMGLGKTVQVLALLAREEEGPRQPALVVAPRSVVFNWVTEAKRFAPGISLHVHHGTGRLRSAARLAKHELVITTYGTLRRDAALLSQVSFRCAILDEAQAIKNPSSQAAKAARLLRAEQRFVLTGTPVENHLDDLWSLFEFLNPGMLGRSTLFRDWAAKAATARRESDDNGTPAPDPFETERARALARVLRPFVLRRTKEQVLRELPPKTEQVLPCVLEGAERRRYEELRDHYRRALLEDERGIDSNAMRMNVLEALLRLRQAACHPGLLDPARSSESSAKLDALLPRLSEVAEGGHKALVFSQFTKLLAIVRERLDAQGLVYEYLDGRTVHREAKVRRFQEDPACPMFLISLKAGGFGLNLAAADYVFLLDPWWNPAVERQAIDRAHRIGQTRAVNAYRLVACGTVEDKVLELQEKKRELAEAVLGEAGTTLRDLTREDLEALLS